MSGRLKDGREFNLFSTTLPVIFDNADKIKSAVEMTDKGVIVTRTTGDAKVAAALQAHANEVTELVQERPDGLSPRHECPHGDGPGRPARRNAKHGANRETGHCRFADAAHP